MANGTNETTSAALARIDTIANAEAVVKAIEEVQLVVQTCNAKTLLALPVLTRAVHRSVGIQQLRKVLTDDVMTIFMNLQGSPLGFITDKDRPPKDMSREDLKNWKPGYPMHTVREVLIEALVRGLQPTDNEFNIISDRMYGAKNGFKRLVLEWPGLTDFRMVNGVPQRDDKTKIAYVAMRATWLLNGKPDKLIRDTSKSESGELQDERFSIKLNYGMGDDGAVGKAERKMYKAVYDILTGGCSGLTDGDVHDVTGYELPDGPAPAPALPEHDGKRISLGKKGNVSAQPPAPEPNNTPAPGNLPHLFPSEIKDVKAWAKERGDEQLVSACEAALTGDDAAKAIVIAARDAMPQREVE